MGKRLLLADDSVTIQKVVEITFADKDYELDLASNGDEALQAAQKQRPDLILADVFMPGQDGYQLCERIKNMPDMAGIPVLLLAGTFEAFDEERAGQVGAAGWISKPFTSQALVDRVEQALAEATDQEQEWKTTPSKSPADSMMNAFEQAAATEFGSGRNDELTAEDTLGTPASPAAPETENTVPSDPFAAPQMQEESDSDFATGGPGEFSFEDLASADTPQESPQPSALQDDAQATKAPSESSFPASETPEPDAIDAHETPSMPADDFSFTPPEPEQPITPESAEESFSDPFAAAEQNKDGGFDGTEGELPSMDEFTTPEPETALEPEVDAVSQDVAPPADAGVIDLQENDIVAEGKYAATEPRVEERAAYLSDEELERIVERVAASVIERLATPIMEKVVWEVVPDLAEGMIREEMDRIRQHADTGN
ncbi:MAG: response regulator [Thermodesulfobacteriota bacterium]